MSSSDEKEKKPLVQRFHGDPDALREWQKRMGLTFDAAAQALDIGRTTYAEMLNGESRIDLRTALACRAIEKGIDPLHGHTQPLTPKSKK